MNISNSNNNKVETPTLIIKENMLKYKDSVIQISNITKCDIAPEPKIAYPQWLFIGFILGTLMLFIKSILFLGLLLLVICSVVFYIICTKNANPNMYLILELNSGNVILFSSQDKSFLWKAQNEVLNCFNNRKEGCIINFSDCTITHSQIGEENLMNNTEV